MNARAKTPATPLRCPDCGYDLSGLRHVRCPECGLNIALSDDIEAVRRLTRRNAADRRAASFVFLAWVLGPVLIVLGTVLLAASPAAMLFSGGSFASRLLGVLLISIVVAVFTLAEQCNARTHRVVFWFGVVWAALWGLVAICG